VAVYSIDPNAYGGAVVYSTEPNPMRSAVYGLRGGAVRLTDPNAFGASTKSGPDARRCVRSGGPNPNGGLQSNKGYTEWVSTK
jgi:hypothetical protein